MADESTFVGHRKYFRWHLKVRAFFEALFILKKHLRSIVERTST